MGWRFRGLKALGFWVWALGSGRGPFFKGCLGFGALGPGSSQDSTGLVLLVDVYIYTYIYIYRYIYIYIYM